MRGKVRAADLGTETLRCSWSMIWDPCVSAYKKHLLPRDKRGKEVRGKIESQQALGISPNIQAVSLSDLGNAT